MQPHLLFHQLFRLLFHILIYDFKTAMHMVNLFCTAVNSMFFYHYSVVIVLSVYRYFIQSWYLHNSDTALCSRVTKTNMPTDGVSNNQRSYLLDYVMDTYIQSIWNVLYVTPIITA